MMTLEAIYENGIFKPVSDTPLNFTEQEHVRITIETDTEEALLGEFAQWDAASAADLSNFEELLGDLR